MDDDGKRKGPPPPRSAAGTAFTSGPKLLLGPEITASGYRPTVSPARLPHVREWKADILTSSLTALQADKVRIAREFWDREAARIRDAFIVSMLGIFGCASTAFANSCANVVVIGTFDESGLRESEFGIYAAGTFRIAGEGDESKQPMFNLAKVDCEKQLNDIGRGFECKVTRASVWASSDKPNPDNPNCSLDLDSSVYSMKELQEGVLTGMATSSACYN